MPQGSSPSHPLRRIITIVLVLAALGVLGQQLYRMTRTTQITVMVRDSVTGEPLGDTVIEVQNSNGQKLIQFVTKADGTAAVKRLLPDPAYRIVARHIDYVPAIKPTVALELHKTTEVRIPLRPKPDGRLYVGLDGGYIATIDTASLLYTSYTEAPEAMRRWPIRDVAVAAGRPWLYVSARYVNMILDPSSMQAIAQFKLSGSARAVGVSNDGRYILASTRSQGEPRLAVFEADTGAEYQYVPVEPLMGGLSDIVPSDASMQLVGDLLVVNSQGEYRAFSLDNWLGRLSIGADLRWPALSPDGKMLYVGQPGLDYVAKVSLATGEMLARWKVGRDISAAAANPNGTELYLVNGQLGLLIVLNTESGEVLDRVPVGSGPDNILVDAAGERVYVANGDSGSITIVDVASRRVIDTIDLGRRPYCMAIR